MTNFKFANWPAPNNVRALTTTRLSGFSQPPFDAFNLGLHVGDEAEHVLKNRSMLQSQLGLQHEPLWLNQTHTAVCVVAGEDTNRDADAAISRSSDYPLVILTADCLPITLCSKEGDEIAAVHAGWRGLFNGVIENTLDKMHTEPGNIMAWIGPAICHACYEVGPEVRASFVDKSPKTAAFFSPRGEKWLANLPEIAEFVLKNHGVSAVYQSQLCTFESNSEFYSYRRHANTGRIATLVWFNHQL